jgi:hypothetical protein
MGQTYFKFNTRFSTSGRLPSVQMRRFKLYLGLAAVGAFLPILVRADSEPLAIRDLDPLLAGYELPPALPSSAAKLGSSQFNVQYDISNTSLSQSGSNESRSEQVIADGEIHRWQFTLSHALSDRFTFRAELPYQSISGGSLDSFIEDFHRMFSLPNGNRAGWPRDRLFIRYSDQGQVVYQHSENNGGFGDISLRAGWHFKNDTKRTASLWFSLKLPTGNAQQLAGSGSLDAALSLAAGQTLGASLTSYEQVSISLLGSGKRMQDQQRTFVWSGTAGITWSMTTRLSVLAQVDAHTRVFDSSTRLLGNSVQLSFGPRYRLGAWQTTLTMSEDLAVDTAPDVQFQLNVGHAL